MTRVGIIVNPASGHDIRRLISAATVVDNSEKGAMTVRLLSGLGATGVDEVLMMPADLTGAILRGADLSGADLRRAVLAGADLGRATLHGAQTRQTDLTDANLTGVRGLIIDQAA